MEALLEKLQSAQARLLSAVTAGRGRERETLRELADTLQELELVAQAAAPAGEGAAPPSALTPTFYASFLLVLLLAEDLNGARFLWKRIPATLKSESETLCKTWGIGKALWQRDFAAAYNAMDQPWPQELQALVELLRASTRESTAELLSAAYSTISTHDAAQALGFAQPNDLLEYCASLQWEVDTAEQFVRPKARSPARRDTTGLEQLETLSKYVLHLEQSTVVKLP
ncbi:hypothetical protein PybrP1_006095 [[Pythium] brassicae (nom. inval.)]|nr:hypothetical protein PybrP1_006095 [[Pythium] brassicae (nom. inval.)]